MTNAAEVHIAEYSAEWPELFAAEARRLREVFLPEPVAIEHIGSTSVPGMAAKPIVDILLGASSLGAIERRIAALESLGYRYAPEVESLLPERRYFDKPAEGASLFHLHAVEKMGRFWRDHIAFRDILRSDRRVFDDYLTLKRNLARTFKSDRAAYTEAKAPFIKEVIARQLPRDQ